MPAQDEAFGPVWLQARLQELAGPLKALKFCLAYSGGMDSCALLHALAEVRRRAAIRIRAVHVNHQLQPQAADWARAARSMACSIDVPCRVLTVRVARVPGGSLEAAARDARYQALRAELKPGELLLTAHHQDDQFETVLLALMRGSGVRGLRAMEASTPFGQTKLLRPLLDIPREQLQTYLEQHAVAWSEDPSNEDRRFDRNYLRHVVIPALRARWPAAAASAGRSAAHLAEADTMLEQMAQQSLRSARDGRALRISALRSLPDAARRNVLRRWLAGHGLPMPDQARLRELAGPLLAARPDAAPWVRWPGAEVRRNGDRLVAIASATAAVSDSGSDTDTLRSHSWDWRSQPWLSLPPDSIGIVPDRHGDLLLSALPAQLTVCFRQGGERLHAHHGSAALKDLLQQADVPPWQRSRVPLLTHAGRIIAVGDLWIDPVYRVRQPGSARAAGTAAPAATAVADRGRLRWRRGD
ncbi:MAG TPA: tRNA lysidine(34) synthetase TilS [Steroidobacteraceae bacterium]|nr:tRNA lysidine(34) synthetase TilS [Steroidobacteraceae bacterium]